MKRTNTTLLAKLGTESHIFLMRSQFFCWCSLDCCFFFALCLCSNADSKLLARQNSFDATDVLSLYIPWRGIYIWLFDLKDVLCNIVMSISHIYLMNEQHEHTKASGMDHILTTHWVSFIVTLRQNETRLTYALCRNYYRLWAYSNTFIRYLLIIHR